MAELVMEDKRLEKKYKNSALVYKAIKEQFGRYCDYKVRCYTSSGDEVLYTDLDVEVYSSGEYRGGINVATIEECLPEECDLFWETVDAHRKELQPLKKRTYNYLKDKLASIEYGEDYTE